MDDHDETTAPLSHDEIEAIFDDLGDADFSARDDMLDKAEIQKRVYALESAFDEAALDIKAVFKNPEANYSREPANWPQGTPKIAWDAWYELQALNDFVTDRHIDGPFVRATYFDTYAKDLTEDLGGEIPSWVVVDWQATVEGIRTDYSAFELDGVTYYAR